MLRESLSLHEQKAPENWETFKARGRLGMAPLLLEAYCGLKLSAGQKSQLKVVSERIVQLYESWGKPTLAADWRERLR